VAAFPFGRRKCTWILVLGKLTCNSNGAMTYVKIEARSTGRGGAWGAYAQRKYTRVWARSRFTRICQRRAHSAYVRCINMCVSAGARRRNITPMAHEDHPRRVHRRALGTRLIVLLNFIIERHAHSTRALFGHAIRDASLTRATRRNLVRRRVQRRPTRISSRADEMEEPIGGICCSMREKLCLEPFYLVRRVRSYRR